MYFDQTEKKTLAATASARKGCSENREQCPRSTLNQCSGPCREFNHFFAFLLVRRSFIRIPRTTNTYFISGTTAYISLYMRPAEKCKSFRIFIFYFSYSSLHNGVLYLFIYIYPSPPPPPPPPMNPLAR